MAEKDSAGLINRLAFTMTFCTIMASKVGRAGVEAPARPDQCQPFEEVNMAVASVPAPSREVKIPNGDLGVIYREVVDFPGYAVGDDGSVWSSRHERRDKLGRIRWLVLPHSEWRRLKTESARYPMVSLCRNRRSHKRRPQRLVLEAFVGPCPKGMEACHDPDPDPSNCRLDNLRWDTHRANHADMDTHGRVIRGERHYGSKLTLADVREIRRLVANGSRSRDLAVRFGVGYQAIDYIRRGQRWSKSL